MPVLSDREDVTLSFTKFCIGAIYSSMQTNRNRAKGNSTIPHRSLFMFFLFTMI